MEIRGMLGVVPSRLAVGEPFALKLKVLGDIRPIACHGGWCTLKPALHGPFNLNVQRNIQYQDNCLPEWRGVVRLDGGPALEGPGELVFDGVDQGVFAGDTRPIKTFKGLRLTEPGFHFLRLTVDGVDGEFWTNPVFVSAAPPSERIWWGDPHWQTFFSDGIRCPEELYAFARDEAFLDFGAASDHVEGLTDRQWDYFVAVTNDYNQAGRFATLVGQEWTKHNPGHRNVYFRGDGGPVLRCTDPRYDSLDKLWQALEGLEAIAFPHHPANKIMGVDWDAGWNPRYEKSVEIYSVWGNSERSAADGNPYPIRHCQGEVPGRHVIDALRRGYRFGFVGGGDIHDGRPGDCLARLQADRPSATDTYPQGFTALFAPELSRDHVFQAMHDRRSYATTTSRVYLQAVAVGEGAARRLEVKAASEEGIARAVVMRQGDETAELPPGKDARLVEAVYEPGRMEKDEFCYVRIETSGGNMAWSSPIWGE